MVYIQTDSIFAKSSLRQNIYIYTVNYFQYFYSVISDIFNSTGGWLPPKSVELLYVLLHNIYKANKQVYRRKYYFYLLAQVCDPHQNQLNESDARIVSEMCRLCGFRLNLFPRSEQTVMIYNRSRTHICSRHTNSLFCYSWDLIKEYRFVERRTRRRVV